MPVKNCKPAATCSFFFLNYKFLYKKQSNVIKKAKKKKGQVKRFSKMYYMYFSGP